MNINMGSVEDVVDVFALIPDDSYIVQVVKSEAGETSTGIAKLDLHLKVVSSISGCEKFKNRYIFQSIIFSPDKNNPSTLSGFCKGLVKRICEATGAEYGVVTEQTFLNKSMVITTKIEYDDYFKEDKSKITKFMPVAGNINKVAQPVVDPTAPSAPGFDNSDEDCCF